MESVETPTAVIDRVASVLGAFDGQPLTLAQIARLSHVPRSSVHRILQHLVDLGWVERRDFEYSVGMRMFELGAQVVRQEQRPPGGRTHPARPAPGHRPDRPAQQAGGRGDRARPATRHVAGPRSRVAGRRTPASGAHRGRPGTAGAARSDRVVRAGGASGPDELRDPLGRTADPRAAPGDGARWRRRRCPGQRRGHHGRRRRRGPARVVHAPGVAPARRGLALRPGR